MFGNNETERRLLKRKEIMDALDKAKEEGITWKVNQLESRLYEFNKKYYPNIFWDSKEKGTYKKPKEVKA